MRRRSRRHEANLSVCKVGIHELIVGAYCAEILLSYLQRTRRFASSRNTAQQRFVDRACSSFLAAAIKDSSEEWRIVIRRKPGQSRRTSWWLHNICKYLYAYQFLKRADSNRGLFPAMRCNSTRLAESYELADPAWTSAIAPILRQLKAKSLLDIGCGTGDLLCELARSKKFVGVGVDTNRSMIRIARRRAEVMDLGKRVSFFNIDASKYLSASRPRAFDGIDTVYCGSVLNSFFGPKSVVSAAQFLGKLSLTLPGRTLVVKDYYGQLCRRPSEQLRPDLGLVHDLMQVLVGQGVPPDSLDEWQAIYRRGNCQLLHVTQGSSSGVNWFVHVLKLNSRALNRRK